MHAQGEEFRDDYRKALPKETVERLATLSAVFAIDICAYSAMSVGICDV